jgi:hypothetical protein
VRSSMRAGLAIILLLAAVTRQSFAADSGPDGPTVDPSPDEVIIHSGEANAGDCVDQLRVPRTAHRIGNLVFTRSTKFGDVVRSEVIEDFYGTEIRSKTACWKNGETLQWWVGPANSAYNHDRGLPCRGGSPYMTIRGFPPTGLMLGPPADPHPIDYFDPMTAIQFHVEDDGRHLVAIDKDGRRLWERNPFEDAALCPYRTIHPIISAVTAPEGGSEADEILGKQFKRRTHFVEIKFNSSQSGVVDARTGDFFFEGQN